MPPDSQPPASSDAQRPAGRPSRGARSGGGTHSAGRARSASGGAGRSIAEFLLTLLVALLIAALVKTFLLQAFRIPSPSMEDTLSAGDRIVVSKLDPVPFETQRGDIIVFEDPAEWLGPADESAPTLGERIESVFVFLGVWPDSSSDHLVKRVVGVGGDHVVCPDAGARLEVNGETVEEPYLSEGTPPCVAPFDVEVPAGSYFVLGDNRANSADSAYHYARDRASGGDGSDGFVDQEDITGRALAVIWPLDRIGGVMSGRAAFDSVPAAS